MYHQRGWKDVTKFTVSCDPAHEHSVHLLRWTDVVRVFILEPSQTAPPAAAPDAGFCES